MTEQTTRFTGFAGQLIASGIDTNMPLVALEQAVDSTTYANLSAINSLIPKIKDVFLHETRIFNSPLEKYITRYDERFGAGLEQAVFMTGAYNEKHDGTCVPRGTPDMASQLDMVNFAYSVDVDVKDREIDKAVLDEGQRGAYVAEKMKTPLKTIGSMKYRAWVQLLSDVVDGTRLISSKTDFNGKNASSGASSVTYNPTIVGYAGKVDKGTAIMPDVAVGSKYAINSPIEAIDICNQLKAVASDFAYESRAYNKLGADTFATGTPLLIAEKKVLDAFDTVFAEFNAKGNANGNYGYAGFPTVSAREYLRQFAELVEIDSFADLPTDPADAVVSYTGYGLKFVLIDRDAFVEVVKWADVEGQRCAKLRLTGYNFAGESILSIWRGVDSYAMVFPKAGTVTFASGQFDIKVGTTDITSGDAIAPGTKITITGKTGYDISTVTVNGTSITVDTVNDKAEFIMPQEPATVVVTTASE